MFRFLRRGNRRAANRLADVYTRFRSKDPHAWLVKGEIEKEFASLDASEAALREGLKRLPNDPLLLCQLGKVLIDKGDLAQAEGVIAAARKADPTSPKPHLCAGHLAYRRRDREGLLEEARLAESRIPGSNERFELLEVSSLLMYVPAERDHVRELLRRALRLGRRDPLTHLWLGVLEETNDPEESRRLLARARKLWPREAQGTEEYEEALRFTRESLSIDPFD